MHAEKGATKMDETNGRVRARVLIADSAELVRRGIRDALASDSRFTVVGEAVRAADLTRASLELMPDVMLVGFEPASDGANEPSPYVAALRETLARAPAIRALVLVDGDSADDLLLSVQAGAQGVLLRDVPAALLVQALEDVLEGGGAIDPRLARSLFEFWRTSDGGGQAFAPEVKPKLAASVLRGLSPREQEVLRSLALGYRNKEIAMQLGVSVGTVKTHLRHIFRKLMVSDRTSAVLTALQARLPEAA
jgi:DNA-binding NarL/FixJ family response regulator